MSNIIQNGASTTVNLQTGEKLAVLAVDGTFSAVIRAGVGVGTALATNALGGEYGPYVSPVVIQISSSADGLVDFEVGTVPTLDYREAVTAVTNPLTGGIENLTGVVGLKVGRFAPLTPLSLALSSDSPAVTSSASATIAGGYTVGRNDSALTYYSHAGIGEFLGYLTYNDTGRLTQIEFMTNSATLEIGIIQFNTNMRVFVDGRLASAAILTTSSGAPIYYKLVFAGRAIRKITIVGINMPFQELVMTAGDAVWSAPDDMPVACIAGDSYTSGSGGTGGSPLAWSVQAGFALGMRTIVDAVGGTGWNTSGADAPLTRLTTVGANSLVKRVAGVNTAIVPKLHAVAYGYNDAGGSMSTLSAAASAYISASSVKPVIVGPWTPAGETENLILVKNALAAVAAASGCKYIDISQFVTTTNKAPIVDGDAVHPTLIGHEYLGHRVAKSIRELAIA